MNRLPHVLFMKIDHVLGLYLYLRVCVPACAFPCYLECFCACVRLLHSVTAVHPLLWPYFSKKLLKRLTLHIYSNYLHIYFWCNNISIINLDPSIEFHYPAIVIMNDSISFRGVSLWKSSPPNMNGDVIYYIYFWKIM